MNRNKWSRLTICLAILVFVSSPWVARGESVDAVKARLVGTWEAAPALDEEVLQGDPNNNMPYLCASAIGVREIYHFAEDGKFTKLKIYRSGPQNGRVVDHLVTATYDGNWEVIEGDKKAAKIRVTLQSNMPGFTPKPAEQKMSFESDDVFTTQVYDLMDRGIRTTFTFRRSPGDCVLQWVAKNCNAGPKTQFADDVKDVVASNMKAEKDFFLCFSNTLVNSGKVTEVQGFCGQFLVFEMTKEQAAELHMGDDQTQASGTNRDSVFPVLTEARIDKVDLGDAKTLDLTKPVTAKVTVVPLHMLGDSGDYSVRMTCQTAQGKFSMFSRVMRGPASDATYNCTFKVPERSAKYIGPLPIAIDFCRTTKFDDGGFSIEVLSTCYSTLREAKPAK